jgi:prepilin-type N-terminal cleavage/methylation domain-containing protein/prepilin-type processing-associated H-X9-DG protein
MRVSRDAFRCRTPSAAKLRPTAYPPRVAARAIRLVHSRGFTLAELLVVVGILVILALLILPMLAKARSASRSVTCLSNLRHLAISFRLYAQEYGGVLPDPAISEISWERSLNRYIGTDAFRCPSDRELAPATGSSYDWRDTGEALTSLAGRSLSEPLRDHAVFVFEALPSWHEKDRMNVAFTDGSVQTLDSGACVGDLEWPIFGEAAYDTARGYSSGAQRPKGGR